MASSFRSNPPLILVPPSLTLPDYPSYELFTQPLREGVFKIRRHSQDEDANSTQHGHGQGGKEGEEDENQSWRGRQLRLVVDKTRRVREVAKM